jgi:hypothetical protein
MTDLSVLMSVVRCSGLDLIILPAPLCALVVDVVLRGWGGGSSLPKIHNLNAKF